MTNTTIEEIEKNISELTAKMLKCNDAIDTRKIASTIRWWKAELEKMQNNSLLACK